MIGIIWALFKTYIVKTFIGRVVAAIAVGGVLLWWNNSVQRQKGADAVITGSIERGKAANATNEKVRARARQPGAAQRVLENYCRDC